MPGPGTSQVPVRVDGDIPIALREGGRTFISPDVDTFADGRRFVVWEDADPNLITFSAKGKIFDSNGDPLTGDFPVSTGRRNGRAPRVSVNAAGLAVVSFSKAGAPEGFFRLFDSDGNPLGNMIRTRSSHPRTAIGPDRLLVVTGSIPGDIQRQFFRLDGSPLEAAKEITDVGFSPQVSMDAAGGFVLVGINSNELLGRCFDPLGVAKGPAFRVDEGGNGSGFRDLDMAPDGHFVVAWATSNLLLLARLFAPDGSALTGDLVVSTSGLTFRPEVSVAIGNDRSFIVAWREQKGRETDVRGRFYSPSGAPVGGSFQINAAETGRDHTPLNQGMCAVSMSPGEVPFAAWVEEIDTLGDAVVMGGRFDDSCLAGNINAGIGVVPPRLFINGSPGAENRCVQVSTNTAIAVELIAAPATPMGTYILYVWAGEPTFGCFDVRRSLLGSMVNNTPVSVGGSGPLPIACIRGAGIPDAACLGVPEHPGPAKSPVVLLHPGFASPKVLTLQALLEDDGARATPPGFGVTNLVVLRIEASEATK